MQIGEWNVEGRGGLLERCPWWQFKRWLEFHEIEPWGDERADFRAAIGHSILANVNRDDKKKSEPFTAFDFMPYLRDKPQAQESMPMTEEEWINLKSMMVAMGKPTKIDH